MQSTQKLHWTAYVMYLIVLIPVLSKGKMENKNTTQNVCGSHEGPCEYFELTVSGPKYTYREQVI